MKLIIKLFGILMLLSGILLLSKPEIIFAWIEYNMENTLLYIFAIGVRAFLGVIFFLAARESKFLVMLKIISYLFIIAAILLILLGQERFQNFITLVFSEVRPLAPVIGLLVIAFGGFLIYAFSRNKEIEQK